MLVDVERVLLELKRYVDGKSHHGQRDLLAEIARLEARFAIEEGLPERTLRQFGLEFFAEAIRDTRNLPASAGARVPRSDYGGDGREFPGSSINESEEDDHGVSDARAGAAERVAA